MSNDNSTENESAENEDVASTGTPRTKRQHLSLDQVNSLVEGIPSFEKKAFTIIGNEQARGVRLAVAATKKVGRVYFYADNDYSLIPEVPGIIVYSEEDRKENRRGGVMAEIDFSLGADVALAALTALVAVVRAAPAKEPRPEKKAKEVVTAADPVVVPPPGAPDEGLQAAEQ